MEIIKYPDGTSYVSINYKQDCPNKTFKLNSYEDLWQLNQFVDACNNNDRIPIITIPCLIDAQADRRFNKDESSGLKLVLKFLNKMKANFKIYHPHNTEVVEAYLGNKVEIIDNSDFIRRVIYNKIYDNKSANNLTVLLPDGGAYKWGAKLMDKISFKGDVIAAAKNRKFIDGKSVLTQQLPNYDFEGKDILIIDDICIYGGTFKGLATILREHNCGKLYLAVSHITVQNHEQYNVFSYFDKVFTTNSKYDVYYERIDGSSGKEIKNLDIIKIF